MSFPVINMKQVRLLRLLRRSKPLRFIALATALVYLSGLVITSVVHPMLHRQHEIALHTAAAEKDACHRAVYHGEHEDGEHHTHLTAVDDACSLCDIILHAEHSLTQHALSGELFHSESHKAFLCLSLAFGYHSFAQGRAPPVLG